MGKNKKAFVTFGQNHRHTVAEQVFDKDTVAVIHAETEEEAREIAFKTFSDKWAFLYFQEDWEDDMAEYYPKGYLYLKDKDSLVTTDTLEE